MTRLPAKRRNKFFLDSYGRLHAKAGSRADERCHPGGAQPHRGIDRIAGRPPTCEALNEVNQRGWNKVNAKAMVGASMEPQS